MKTRLISSFLAFVVFCTFSMAATPAEQRRKDGAAQSSPKRADLSTITVNGVADIDPAKAFGSKDARLVMEIVIN